MKPSEAKNIAAASCETHEVEFLSRFRQECGHGHEWFSKTTTIPFSNEWFTRPSNEYNPGLAYAGMGLSLSTYLNDPSNDFHYIKDTLATFELEDLDISTYYHRNSENDIDFRDDINLISYAIGHKKIALSSEGQKTLVMCVVRGTSHTVEWVSNADVADFVIDGNYDLPYHEGFKKTADEAMGQIERYLDEHGIDSEKAILWIVGHSRGATIVNLLAAFMNEGGWENPPVEARNLRFSKDRVYAYTYSASLTTRRSDARSAAFDNIFNVTNPEDYIPRIPLTFWGYERFGRDLFLPSIATAYESYRAYIQSVYDQFLAWTNIEYQAFNGFERTNLFERNAADISLDVKAMYENERFSHGGTLTFAQYFRVFCDTAGRSGLGIARNAEQLGRYAGGPFEHFLNYFMRNQIVAHEAPGAHQEEGYLAKLKFIYEMDIDIEGQDVCDTKRFTVYGKVDLVVKDEDGTVVAHIKNGSIDRSLYKIEGFIAMFCHGELNESSVWIPDSMRAQVEISSHQSEPIDVTIARETMLGNVVWLESYPDLELPRDRAVTWDDAKPCAPCRSWKRDREGLCHIAVCAEGAEVGSKCDVMGVAQAVPGEHAVVHAYHAHGVQFLGWYESDGNSMQLVSRDRSYVFRVEKDRQLTARFKEKR